MKSLINDEFFGRLETLALNLRTNLAGYFGGKHRTRSYGQTVEFADYREYMLGDDIRRIDWNLYSRFEKFFLKLFTDERQMHIQIILDCSGSMGLANPDKGAYAVAVAAALGFLSVHNMDKVSFKLVKKNVAEDLGGTIVGKTTFFKTISELEKIEFKEESDLSEAISQCPVGSNDGLTVIISDFFAESDSWKKAVDYLNYKRRQIMLVQIFTPEELDPAYSGRMHFLDAESDDMSDSKNLKVRITGSMQKAYQEALNDFRQDIKTFCTSRGVDYFVVRTDQAIEKMIFGELLRTGILV